MKKHSVKISDVKNLVCLLDFEYDRMSQSGKKTFEDLCKLLRIQ